MVVSQTLTTLSGCRANAHDIFGDSYAVNERERLQFPNDPEKMGYVSYTRMKWHEHRGDLNKALEYANLALGCFQNTNNNSQIGKAMINVAHFQYQKGNFDEAKNMLSSSLGYLHSYDYAKLYAIKDYVKTLIRLGENDYAVQVIEQHMELAKEYPDLNGRLQILHSMAEDTPLHAEKVIESLTTTTELRYYACKFLMEYYASKRDSESLLLYYEKSTKLLKYHGATIDEEGF